MLRIIQIGLGPLGRRVLEDLADRGLGRVVGAVDRDPNLVGRELADIVPGIGDGVRVAPSVEELGDTHEANCAVVTTASALESCHDTFVALLERGLSAVSSCEELAWPWLRHPVLAAELHERCVRGGARLLGTGVNPGFVMDALPVVLSGVCRSVRGIEVWRVQDAATRRVPFQRKIGATLDLEAFEARRVEGSLRHVGLGESLHLVASSLGLPLERWEESLEPVIAEADLECALGPIPAGHAAGVRQVGVGHGPQGPVVRLVFQAAIGQADPHDRVRIDGEPPVDLRIEGGVHGDVATSAVLLNAIPALLEAQPGLHTMVSIRPPRCGSNAR